MMKSFFLALTVLFLASCTGPGTRPPLVTGAENATDMRLTPAAFTALPGWQMDDASGALAAFRKSCAVMMRRDNATAVAPTAIAGRIADWRPACEGAANANDAKSFLNTYFQPYRVETSAGSNGLFTGYYETMLNGSMTRSDTYNVPLYARPDELVMVELGEFREGMKGERIAGRVVDGKLKPFADRAAIDRGALSGRGLEILYVDDADAAFFLHIQGSGRVKMDDGRVLRVGYDGQNGHVYYAIGRDLIARGALTKDNVSLQTIRAWLKAHPAEAAGLRQKNPSYVFFKILESGEGPIGAQNVALTAQRSLAIDPRFIPYGAPVFLDAPHPEQGKPRINRLLIAQDTGGAIRGPVRGDVFWGSDEAAEHAAGLMKSRGQMWVLLPKTLQGPRQVVLQAK